MLSYIIERDPRNLQIIDNFVSERFPAGGVNISSVERAGKRVYFTSSVFEIPATETEPDLLAAMMPFGAAFGPVHNSISEAARRTGMRCQRANDIWIHSAIIQDVFSLIYRSHIVVCDFTGRNPNVFYEAGIAHNLANTLFRSHNIRATFHSTYKPIVICNISTTQRGRRSLLTS
jgi:hypothetical protein